jgi:hypothetical protein
MTKNGQVFLSHTKVVWTFLSLAVIPPSQIGAFSLIAKSVKRKAIGSRERDFSIAWGRFF